MPQTARERYTFHVMAEKKPKMKLWDKDISFTCFLGISVRIFHVEQLSTWHSADESQELEFSRHSFLLTHCGIVPDRSHMCPGGQ